MSANEHFYFLSFGLSGSGNSFSNVFALVWSITTQAQIEHFSFFSALCFWVIIATGLTLH